MTESRDDHRDRDPLAFPAPVKLDRLDPARDSAAFDRRVLAIAADALAQRTAAPQQTVLGALGAWSAPAIAAAAAIVIAAGVAVTLLPLPAAAAPASFAESAGIARPLVQWSADNHSPTADELFRAVSGRLAGSAQ